MKRLFIFSLISLYSFSCTPDGQMDNSGQTDTLLADSFGVDTFSVVPPKILTEAEKKEIADNKVEVDSIVTDASLALHTSDPENKKKEDAIFTNYDIGPSFPGGGDAMDAYIIKHRIYPLIAFQNDIKGTVRLKVVVERDGKIGGIEVLKGLGYGCDEVAIDLVRSMPKWTPGKKGGAPVRCSIVVPITFGF